MDQVDDLPILVEGIVTEDIVQRVVQLFLKDTPVSYLEKRADAHGDLEGEHQQQNHSVLKQNGTLGISHVLGHDQTYVTIVSGLLVLIS